MNGNGQWNYPENGSAFSGNFINGQRSGFGVMIYDITKGVKFEGEWKLNKPGGGKGVYITDKGERIEGLWENGMIIPNDVHQPEFTDQEGNMKVWSDLDEESRNKVLEISL